MNRRDRLARRAATLFVLAASLLAGTQPARAAKLREIFPEFEARRAALGDVVLLADVVAIRQEGGTPVFRRQRSRLFADSILVLAKEMLERKGLTVSGVQLASMGITFSEDRGYRSADTDTSPATELVNPPFFVDTLFGATPEREKGWRSLNKTLGNYQRKKKDAPVSLGPAVELAKLLGAGSLAVVRLTTWDVPIGKQLASLLLNNNSQSSSGFIGLTIVSGEDGMILWDDWMNQQTSLKPETLREKLEAFEKRLP